MPLAGANTMKKLSPDKRTKLLLVVSLTLVVMAGLWFGLINPQNQKLRSMADRKAASARKLQQVTTAVENGPAVRAQLEKEAGALDKLEEKMASGDLNSWAFNTIRQFKTPYKIEIPQFGRIDGPKDSNFIPKFPYKEGSLTVAGTADFFELGRFISDFENEFPYFRIANLSLEPATGAASTEPERLAFKMEIIALVKPNKS
jgi:hypothetical protein